MNKTTGLRGLQLFVGGALMLVASLSQAQWVWTDAKGVKQFSDRSPPPSVPQKNILKAPRGQATALDIVEPGEAAAPAAAVAAAKPTLADREGDYRKRQAEKAEADKKAANEAAVASSKKAHCDSVRAQKAQLDSGVRVSSGAADGGVMDDAQRAKETAAARKALADC